MMLSFMEYQEGNEETGQKNLLQDVLYQRLQTRHLLYDNTNHLRRFENTGWPISEQVTFQTAADANSPNMINQGSMPFFKTTHWLSPEFGTNDEVFGEHNHVRSAGNDLLWPRRLALVCSNENVVLQVTTA